MTAGGDGGNFKDVELGVKRSSAVAHAALVPIGTSCRRPPMSRIFLELLVAVSVDLISAKSTGLSQGEVVMQRTIIRLGVYSRPGRVAILGSN
jgi:hypothetical protein